MTTGKQTATADQQVASGAEQLQMSDGTPAESYLVQVRTGVDGESYLYIRLRARYKEDEVHRIPIGSTGASLSLGECDEE